MLNDPSVHPVATVLGGEAGLYAQLLALVLPAVDGASYEFTELDDFRGSPPPRMNRIYWTEILYRAHWAAASTLIRADRWLAGLASAHADSNLMALAACARGLIESAADSYHGLKGVPVTLARDHRLLASALQGTLLSLTVNPVLESQLIHYTHARKPAKGESVPEGQRAKHVAEYRKVLDEDDPAVAECYATLCDLTHPGASSVLSYAIARTDSRVEVSRAAESVALEDIEARLQAIAPSVLMLGLNGALVTLKLLHLLGPPELRAAVMDQVDLSGIALWHKVAAALESAA